MHNYFERRLERLERELAYSYAGGGSGDDRRREFIIGVLDALRHVRRAVLDEGRTDAYTAAILENLPPFELGQYVCALTILSHPDGDGARRLLLDSGGGGFMPFIENIVSHHLKAQSRGF